MFYGLASCFNTKVLEDLPLPDMPRVGGVGAMYWSLRSSIKEREVLFVAGRTDKGPCRAGLKYAAF